MTVRRYSVRLRPADGARCGWEAGLLRSVAGIRGALAVYSLVALALVIRIAYYLVNPTLSTDEAQLALNITGRSYSDLAEPLDFNQAAPVGFLFVEKLVGDLVGSSEYALRLFPLLSALAAVLLFFPVASKFIGHRAALLALALFVVSELLLVYAATSKQYASDVAVTLMLYGMTLWATETFYRRRIIVLALAGATAVWFSHPAIFVEAAICSVLMFDSLVRRRWRAALYLAIVGTIWMLAFALFYLHTHATYSHLQESFAGNAAVLGVGGSWDSESRAEVYAGTVRALFGIPHFTFGLRNLLSLVASLLCLIGVCALLMRRRTHALLLVGPVPFVLLASAVGKYPLFPRTLLFLVPAMLMILAYGVGFLVHQTTARSMRVAAGLGFAAVVIAGAVPPADHLWFRDGGELKQVMRQVADNQRLGEALYVYAGAQYDLRYYLECGCFGRRPTVRRARALWPLDSAPGGLDQSDPTMRSVLPQLVVGKATSGVPSDYLSDFAQLRGRRVWILIAAAPPQSRHALLDFLDSIGTPKTRFYSNGDIATAVLYELHD